MGLLDLIGEKFAKDAQAKLDADAAARAGVLPQQNSQLLSNLRDFAQGASNSAAATVSAPVDGIAWLLRKAGVPVPAAPVGGSDWMAAQGLTQQPKNHTAGLLGEAVGGVVPIVAQAKAAQIAKGLLQMGENAAAPTTLGKQAGALLVDSSSMNKAPKDALYHVAPENHSGDLLSLVEQHGNDAYDMYASKWPEAGDLWQVHPNYVHLHDTLDAAKEYANQFGGKIYAVDKNGLKENLIKVIRDRDEYDHPMVKGSIPAELLSVFK